jgi:cytochrome c peroxidase
LAGTDEICIIDRVKLHQRLSGTAGGESANYVSASNIKSDYKLLSDIKKRVKLKGKGPRGLALVDDLIYVSEYFTGTLNIISLKYTDYQPKSCSLGFQPGQTPVRKGEQYFNDAEFCFQKWQSCVSCHPDVRTDGLNWDLLNDGIGNPKNTKSLVYSHFTPPAMITGIRPNAEAGVRAGLKYIQFAQRPEADAKAIDLYLKSLKNIPSPFLENGNLSQSAGRGKLLFMSADCINCHSGPYHTDLNKYNVGTGDGLEKATEFDTPSLNELWRSAPYLYDGRALTLKEVFTTFNPHDNHGRTSHLSGHELNDLIQYLNSL